MLNADARAGEIRVALLGQDGNELPGYSFDRCVPIRSDSLAHAVTWRNSNGLPRVPVKIKLRMRSAKVYSFWTGSREGVHL